MRASRTALVRVLKEVKRQLVQYESMVSNESHMAFKHVKPESCSAFMMTSYVHTTATKQETSSTHSSVNAREVAKFAKLSEHWWDPSGPCKPLHALNKARCEFIKDVFSNMDPTPSRVLDVGCGGGILSESLARMGVHVTGIDVHAEGIDVAEEHKKLDDSIVDTIEYRTQSIEELLSTAEGPGSYDVVIASEVIEHVDALQDFCSSLVKATKPGGRIIISTLNRTSLAYLMAIVGAEHLLRIVPEGTHEWSKFVTPEEVVHLFPSNSASLDWMAGMTYQPFTDTWYLSKHIEVNYIASFIVH